MGRSKRPPLLVLLAPLVVVVWHCQEVVGLAQFRKRDSMMESCVPFAPMLVDDITADDEETRPDVLARHRNQSMLAAANQCFHRGAQYHCLPALLMPGVQKGGTSAARDLLQSGCVRTVRNEVHYFDGVFSWQSVVKSFRTAYLRQFPVPKGMIADGHVPIYFDKTPRYINVGKAAELSARLMPFARSLLMLREPVSRMLSHYIMNCQGRGPLYDWYAVPSQKNSSVLRMCAVHMKQQSRRAAFTNPDCPKNVREISGAVKLSCSTKSFDHLVPAIDEAAHVQGRSSWEMYKYGPEGTLLQRSLYVPQVERWISAYSHGRSLTVLHEDLGSHITVLWPLAMWYLGFDVPGAILANGDDPLDHSHGTPMPNMPNTAFKFLHQSGGTHRHTRSLRTTHAGMVPDSQTHKLSETVFCEENRRLAKLFAPMPFPGAWHCTEPTDEVRAASRGHLHTRIPVSSEYLSAAARHDPASRVPVGEWHIYRIPFTAERELPWNRRSVNGEAWMWGARFIITVTGNSSS